MERQNPIPNFWSWNFKCRRLVYKKMALIIQSKISYPDSAIKMLQISFPMNYLGPSVCHVGPSLSLYRFLHFCIFIQSNECGCQCEYEKVLINFVHVCSNTIAWWWHSMPKLLENYTLIVCFSFYSHWLVLKFIQLLLLLTVQNEFLMSDNNHNAKLNQDCSDKIYFC